MCWCLDELAFVLCVRCWFTYAMLIVVNERVEDVILSRLRLGCVFLFLLARMSMEI